MRLKRIKKLNQQNMTVHACNPSAWEVEAGGSRVLGPPGLHTRFQDNLSCIGRPCLKKRKEERKSGGEDKRITIQG
jgi:hypothetical protein